MQRREGAHRRVKEGLSFNATRGYAAASLVIIDEASRVPDDVPRISKAFLEDEERLLGPLVYRQEYFCEFFDADSQYFSTELIEAALTDEIAPLWGTA